MGGVAVETWVIYRDEKPVAEVICWESAVSLLLSLLQEQRPITVWRAERAGGD